MQWLQRAIEGDDLPALKTLGIFYRDGTCMPKDLAKAASLFKRGAELGNAEAMSNLAVSYRDGQGVQRDYDLMLKWVRAAMEAGDTYAYSALAEAYHNGFGVVKSQKEAVTWWRKGVDAGCGICAAQLAKWHYSERGDNPNDNEAARLFLQAVEVDQGGRLNEEGVSNASLAQREFDRLLAEGRITDQEVLKRIRASSLPSPSATWLVTPSSTDAESIMLQVSLSDVGGGMGRVELRVNDIAVGECSRAASDSRAASATEGAAGVRYIYHLRVAAGTHRLEIRAYNKDSFINFSTLTTSIVSTYELPRKPRLFAVVVGIDHYENSRLKLKFAGSDARAIGDLLKTQIKNGGLYSGGDVVVLTTKADTSKARITQALSALHDGKKLRADDVFVLFVAGHGSFDSDVRRYTMFTSDVLQLSIEWLAASGISSDELQALVRNIPTLKKLILLDTCNSGGAFEGEGASAYFKPKQARSGIEE